MPGGLWTRQGVYVSSKGGLLTGRSQDGLEQMGESCPCIATTRPSQAVNTEKHGLCLLFIAVFSRMVSQARSKYFAPSTPLRDKTFTGTVGKEKRLKSLCVHWTGSQLSLMCVCVNTSSGSRGSLSLTRV